MLHGSPAKRVGERHNPNLLLQCSYYGSASKLAPLPPPCCPAVQSLALSGNLSTSNFMLVNGG